MRSFLVLFAAVLVSASSAGAAAAPTLIGHVSLQSIEPQCGKAGCARGAQAVVLRFQNAARSVRRVETNPKGDCAVVLAPGVYRVSVAQTGAAADATITPARISIRAGLVSRLTFAYRPGR